MENESLPKGAKISGWYLLVLFGLLLIWEVFGRVWNATLFEKTGIMMGVDASIGIIIFYIFGLYTAASFLKIKRFGFFSALTINGLLLLGCGGALTDMVEKAQWSYSWPYAVWASIFFMTSLLSIIAISMKNNRKIFFKKP